MTYFTTLFNLSYNSRSQGPLRITRYHTLVALPTYFILHLLPHIDIQTEYPLRLVRIDVSGCHTYFSTYAILDLYPVSSVQTGAAHVYLGKHPASLKAALVPRTLELSPVNHLTISGPVPVFLQSPVFTISSCRNTNDLLRPSSKESHGCSLLLLTRTRLSQLVHCTQQLILRHAAILHAVDILPNLFQSLTR